MTYDVFISYCSADRDGVRRVVAALQAAGLNVWWDQLIPGGEPWSDEIEAALDSATRVVALLSKSITTAQRYYVHAEMDRAHTQRKLLAVQIGEFALPLNLNGLVWGAQLVRAQSFDELAGAEQLLAACRPGGARARAAPEPNGRVQDWLETRPDVGELALAIALAVSENAPTDEVSGFADLLETRLREAIAPPPTSEVKAAPPAIDLFAGRGSRLRRIGAREYEDVHPRWAVTLKCARFEADDWAANLLADIWDERINLRPILIDWLTHVTRTARADARYRIGMTIGALARGSRFLTLMTQLIGPWLLDKHPATRDVADIALWMAVIDPETRQSVQMVIKDLTVSGNVDDLRAAVELACGYTGMRLGRGDVAADMTAIDVLQSVAKRARELEKSGNEKTFKIYEAMHSSVTYMIKAVEESRDGGAFDAARLLQGLAGWVQTQTGVNRDRLPIFLFLTLMEGLALLDEADPNAPTLATLMSRMESRDAVAEMFDAALVDPMRVNIGHQETSARDMAQKILKRWAEDKRHPMEDEADPLIALGRAIHERGRSENDRQRIAFQLRARYSAAALTLPASNFAGVSRFDERL